MSFSLTSRLALAAAVLLAGLASYASNTRASEVAETVQPAFRYPLANVPGKSIVGVLVSYAPGAKSPAHFHARSAFITAYVLSGAIRSQVEGEDARVFKAGESWTEIPGAHHVVSENASATEPASLLAVFILDSTETELTRL